MNLAAAGATWGINSPTFLLIYAILAVTVSVVAVIQRRRLLGGSARISAAAVTAQRAAYLNGGGQLAIYSSLAALRCAGSVTVTPAPGRYLVALGTVPAHARPLDLAVCRAAGRRLSADELAADAGVAAEVERLRVGLERDRLLLTAGARRAIRTWRQIMLGVLLLGVARLVAGLVNDKLVLALVMVMAILAAVILSLWDRASRTWAGDRVLIALRNRHSHLSPVGRPSWRVYGAADAAMGVAIFGSEALWTADPAFAAAANIARGFAAPGHASYDASSGVSSNSGGGSGGSSAGSSGGGGCGG
jgi:uncharacterized protein (TIGR04222 family)